MLPIFIRPGKHSYFVKSDSKHYAHQLLVPCRDEEIPHCKKFSLILMFLEFKQLKYRAVERYFKKDTSVFKDWREDTH